MRTIDLLAFLLLVALGASDAVAGSDAALFSRLDSIAAADGVVAMTGRGHGVSTDRAPLALALLIPDRFPSLVVLVGFWIPPAVAGWVAAGFAQGCSRRGVGATYAVLAAFVLVYAGSWFFFNLGRMPPYIPGASADPTVATPRSVAGLALVASVLVLPGSAIVCAIAFRARRLLGPPSSSV